MIVRLALAGEKLLAQQLARQFKSATIGAIVMINQKELKERLHYNHETGVFTWKTRPIEHFKGLRSFNGWNTRCAGKVAGGEDRCGYQRIIVDSTRYQSHRLAWLYVHGEFPASQIDHINGKRDDNRLVNLRSVSQQENLKNQKKRTDNKSGFVGVHWNKGCKKWMAYINSGGKRENLGLYNDINLAITARAEAEPRHGFHKNHGR